MSEEWANIEGKLVLLKKRRWWQIWKPRIIADAEYPMTINTVTEGTDLTPYTVDFTVNPEGWEGGIPSKFNRRVTGTFGGGDEDE